ncbi:hypothetical protein AGDE_07563 [Angomonas deanei]|nr:hypothetical protein AGDE_07563 [Angomonas deanei]|eukprot:EPY35149.1 hypothetical protein AGDE_07563 [Angomonas deanei]
MSTKSTYQAGDIIRPLPSSYKVVGDKLIFPDGGSYHHGESFNATVISHFIVATEPLTSDDVVVLNFNLIFYDTMKSTDSGVFTNPCVTGFRYLEESDKQRLYKYADECVREAAIRDNFLPQEKENGIDVVNRKGSLASVSSQDRAKGEVVFQTTGVLLPFPVRSTVEIPGDLHVRLTGGTEFMRHSCLPNLRLEVEGSEIRGVALRPIEAGELLTFNYLCTEWEVTKVFQCSCNKYCCYGLIKGFKYLDPEQQEHLLPNCCPAVREKYCSPMLRTTSLAALNTTSSLSVQSDGKIVSQMYVAAGTVLVRCADEAVVEGSRLVLGGLRIPHSCDANTCLIEGRLVTSRALVSGDCLTFNINSFSYELNHPFDCDCKSSDCVKRVSGFKSLSNERKDKLWLIASNSARNAALKDNYKIPSSSSMVEVKATESIGQATFAAVNIPSGKCVFHVTGLVIPFPTVYTIYIGQGKHLLFAGGAQCLAHSCQPNTRIVVDPVNGSLDCFATEPIPEGKLISFNYLTTEWDMNEPFPCACGAPNCFKKIEGFAHLSKEDKLRLWSQTTSAVASRFATSTTGSILTNIDREVAAPKGAEGHLHTCQELTSGTLLFECLDYDVVGKYVYFGDVRVPHSCSPSAVFLAGKVVLSQAAPANTVITVNINHLYYTVEAPFQCDCGSDGCVGRVGGFSQLTDAQKDAIILCTDPAVREEACKNGYKNKSSSPLVDVRDNGGMGQATFSTRNIAKGTRFFNVHGLVLPFPTVYTIMLDRGRHLLFADGAQCLAHSCNPNVRIIVDPEGRSLDCLALRDINEGELISFNYLTTEWDMNSPFRCVCESANCFGKIAGFKYLNSVQRQQLWSLCSPAIKSEVNMSGNWSRLSSPELTTDSAPTVTSSASDAVFRGRTPV